jgi:hypothetical protein
VGPYGVGWVNFARSFHPFLLFSLTLGDYEFIGFDSGPSVPSPRVLTRGVSPETVDALRARVQEAREHGRGVVLLSHAASRALSTSRGNPASPGLFGRMKSGGAAFEQVMLEAAAAGQRVVHLNGHTHWSDVFEARPSSAGRLEFVRWPPASLSPCLTTIPGKAAIITVQSASHSGVAIRESARGWGFDWLVLGDGGAQVAFHRYGLGHPAVECPVAP